MRALIFIEDVTNLYNSFIEGCDKLGIYYHVQVCPGEVRIIISNEDCDKLVEYVKEVRDDVEIELLDEILN